jgi:hypothetical protein
MRGWHVRRLIIIIHVVERVFVEGVSTPSLSLGTCGIVRFVMQREWIKQMKKELKN